MLCGNENNIRAYDMRAPQPQALIQTITNWMDYFWYQWKTQTVSIFFSFLFFSFLFFSFLFFSFLFFSFLFFSFLFFSFLFSSFLLLLSSFLTLTEPDIHSRGRRGDQVVGRENETTDSRFLCPLISRHLWPYGRLQVRHLLVSSLLPLLFPLLFSSNRIQEYVE